MLPVGKLRLLAGLAAGMFAICQASASMAQFNRYQPSTPTVSPYLMLFNNNRDINGRNNFLPNYYQYVRPMQQQLQFNQNQQQLIQDQSRQIQQLQNNVQILQQQQQQPQTGPLVAPTGHNSWFGRNAPTQQFMNTSRFYSQSGTRR